MARDHVMSVRLDDSEKVAVEAAAEVRDMAASEFARRVVVTVANLTLNRTDPDEAAAEAADETRAKIAGAAATLNDEGA